MAAETVDSIDCPLLPPHFKGLNPWALSFFSHYRTLCSMMPLCCGTLAQYPYWELDKGNENTYTNIHQLMCSAEVVTTHRTKKKHEVFSRVEGHAP